MGHLTLHTVAADARGGFDVRDEGSSHVTAHSLSQQQLKPSTAVLTQDGTSGRHDALPQSTVRPFQQRLQEMLDGFQNALNTLRSEVELLASNTDELLRTVSVASEESLAQLEGPRTASTTRDEGSTLERVPLLGMPSPVSKPCDRSAEANVMKPTSESSPPTPSSESSVLESVRVPSWFDETCQSYE